MATTSLQHIWNFKVTVPMNVFPVSFPGHAHSQTFNAPDDLPKTVARTLNQGSSPMSMDFHPMQQTLLLGCWDQRWRYRVVGSWFKREACSKKLQGLGSECMFNAFTGWSSEGFWCLSKSSDLEP
ncbi:hypothetical protein ACJIZ3_008688 [Penstemon smallii]|uniref:Uncharacterized protein n=1 Tax=Penstemon smallii TaxID=265156 RepID=A0ABD3TAW3_9LAMI